MPAQVILTVIIIWVIAEIMVRLVLGFSLTGTVIKALRELLDDSGFAEEGREAQLRARKRELKKTSTAAAVTSRTATTTRELAGRQADLRTAEADLAEAEGSLDGRDNGDEVEPSSDERND